MIFWFIFIILFLPISIFFPTKVIHKERMPKKEKIIVTSNHYSNFDSLIYIAKFKRKFRFLCKIELFKNKFFGFILRHIGAIPVNRENLSPSTFKEVLGELKQNHQVFIFPEGTRNKGDEQDMGDVKLGVIIFASKGETSILPMMIYRKPKLFRKNYILVGEKIEIVGENPKKLTKEEQELNLANYTEAMNSLRSELEEYVKGKKKNKKA